VGRSHRTNTRNATTDVVATAAATHRQHSTTMTAVLPPGAGHEAMLEVARLFLHNPLDPHASPSIVEQWHHGVDQLIVAAINTLPRGGWWANHLGGAPVPSMARSCSPTVRLTSSAPRAPAASLATTDLRAELERHRSGEDNHISIEQHQERRRNLNADFGAADTTPVRQAAHTPTSRDLGVAAWRLPHTFAWWSNHASSGPTVEVSYATPQAHGIVNVVLQREYSTYIFSRKEGSLS
jgi:hypothetical protein